MWGNRNRDLFKSCPYERDSLPFAGLSMAAKRMSVIAQSMFVYALLAASAEHHDCTESHADKRCPA